MLFQKLSLALQLAAVCTALKEYGCHDSPCTVGMVFTQWRPCTCPAQQVFVTVQAALGAAACVRPGDRALVHTAAGGVGLAALQVRATSSCHPTWRTLAY